MTYENTRNVIKTALNETFDTLDTWFEVEGSKYNPQDGGWSIHENLEHITLTSYFLLKVIRKGRDKALKRYQNQEDNVEGESELEALAHISDPDAFEWIRPEHMQPTGEKSNEEIRQLMKQQLNECLQILDDLSQGAGSLYKVQMSVQNLGKIDMYQWLYFLAQHAKRHIPQIEAVYSEYQSLLK